MGATSPRWPRKIFSEVDQIALARTLLSIARHNRACLTLHGDAALAKACGADGVHLPAGSDPIASRAMLGPAKLIGVSLHTVTEAEVINPSVVDYAIAGPTFETPSKPGYGPETFSAVISGILTRMPSNQDAPLKTYLDHLARGELAYQFSPEAGRAVFYPRMLCPFTGSDRLEWRISKGLGTVYATTVVHPIEGKPFNVALIDCDEGFRLMSRVEDIAPEQVRIGQRVHFRVHQPGGEEPPQPVFVPVEGA